MNLLPLPPECFEQLIALQKEIDRLLVLIRHDITPDPKLQQLRQERLQLLETRKFGILWEQSGQDVLKLNDLTRRIAAAAR